jgi:N-acetylmuramoyl-L-alanine amidase
MTERDRCTQRKDFPFCLFCACLVLLLFSPFTYAQTPGTDAISQVRLHTVQLGGVPYLSLGGLAETLGGRLRSHRLKQKVELKLGGHTVVLTWLSALVVIDDVACRMPLETRLYSGGVHVPADAFLTLLQRIIPKGRIRVVRESPTAGAAPPPSPGRQTESDGRVPKVDPKRWTLDTVIVDPGHGGKDPGATGPGGTAEKKIALRVAKRLKTLLEKRLRVRAVLTRDDDTFVPLRKRAQMARKSGGKLFLSLHCNASENRRSRGMEVYFLSEAKTLEAAEVARRENEAIAFEKNGADSDLPAAQSIAQAGGLDPGLGGITSGLLSTQFLKESQNLAASIRTEIAQTLVGVEDRGVKQANFYVMRYTMGDMPSALVEMGFLSNPTEEKRLRSTAFQKAMAEAIYRGLKTFKRRYEQQLSTAR